jgi:hypothetical protein
MIEQTGGRIDGQHLATDSVNGEVPSGPDMVCYMAPMDWFKCSLQKIYDSSGIDPVTYCMG